MAETDRPARPEAGAQGADPTAEAERIWEVQLKELQRWGRKYERDEHRHLIRNVRYAEPEWERVCERAAGAGWPPATFVRLAALFEPAEIEDQERHIQSLCEQTRRLLDLISVGASGLGSASTEGEAPGSLQAYMREARLLRGRLERLHHTRCLPHSSATCVLPCSGAAEAAPGDHAADSNPEWPPPSAGAHSESAGVEGGRTVERSVRFREDEWAHVEVRAARAGLEPATYLREAALGKPVATGGLRRTLELWREVAQDIVDLAKRTSLGFPGRAEMLRGAAEIESLGGLLGES